MNNGIYELLSQKIINNIDEFNNLLNLDNPLGLEPTTNDILEYLEFTNTETVLNDNNFNNVIITEGDVLSTLKIIHDLSFYEGSYILYINDNNKAINTFLIRLACQIYNEYELNIKIKIDYSKNYNDFLEVPVTLIGSEEFINAAAKDFVNCNKIEV